MTQESKSIFDLINKKYPPNQYAVLEEVSNAAGFNRSRSADFIIMSLWPSRGLDLIGMERKSYRSDWLSELKKPEKAESFFKYCDYFYLITDNDNVAKLEEIPAPWGWIHVEKNKLITKKEPVKLNPLPLERTLLAALLKRAVCKDDYTRNDQIKDKLSERYEAGKISEKRESERFQKMYGDLLKDVKDFEQASGIDLKNYPRWSYGPAKMGDAVKLICNNGVVDLERRLNHLLPTATSVLKDIQLAIDNLKYDQPIKEE